MEEVECPVCVDCADADGEVSKDTRYQCQHALHHYPALCIVKLSAALQKCKTAVGDLTTTPVPMQDNIDPLSRTPNR